MPIALLAYYYRSQKKNNIFLKLYTLACNETLKLLHSTPTPSIEVEVKHTKIKVIGHDYAFRLAV